MNPGIVISATMVLSGISGAVAQEIENKSDTALKQRVAGLLHIADIKFASRLFPETLSSLKYTDNKLHNTLLGNRTVDGYPVIETIAINDVERSKIHGLLQDKVEHPDYGFNYSPKFSFAFKNAADQQGYILFDPKNRTARIIIGEQRRYVAISEKLARFVQELDRKRKVSKGSQ